MELPLLGQTSEAFQLDVAQERTINWYPSIETSGKSKLVLNPTPGITSQKETVTPTSGTGCRGGDLESNIFVIGSTVYAATNQSSSSFGDLTTNTGRVAVASGGELDTAAINQYLITDGAEGYVIGSAGNMWTLDGGTVSTSATASATSTNHLVDTTTPATFVTDGVKVGMTVYNSTTNEYAKVVDVVSETNLELAADIFTSGDGYDIQRGYGIDWSAPKTCTYMDGYFILDDQSAGTRGRFYISSPNDANVWNALDFGEAQRHADKIIAIVTYKRELWLIGEKTTEVWYNSGNADFPFEPIQSGFIEYGTASPYTAIQVDDTLLWLATTRSGSVIVAESSGGLGVSSASNQNISQILTSANYSGAFALAYSYGAHSFYAITLPNSDLTLVYNISTKLWHEVSTSGAEWDVGHISNVSPRTYNVARLASNNVHQLSFTNFSDEGSAVERTRVSAAIHADDKSVFHHAVEIDAIGFLNNVIAGFDNPSKIIITDSVDLASLGITTTVDYVKNVRTGVTNVIATVSSSSILILTDALDYVVGDIFEIYDGATDTLIEAYDVELRFKDNNTTWSAAKTRTAVDKNTRYKYRRLGHSRDRVYEISVTSIAPVTIKECYAEVSTGTS